MHMYFIYRIFLIEVHWSEFQSVWILYNDSITDRSAYVIPFQVQRVHAYV